MSAVLAGMTVVLAAYAPATRATPLATTPGLSPVQQPVANAIDIVCPTLRPTLHIDPIATGTPQERFFYSCTSVVQTSAGLQNLPSNNFDRKLTHAGRKQVAHLGRWLKEREPRPDRILHSPLKRACETAGITLGDIDEVFHGTTVATNAILEGKGARVGLVPRTTKFVAIT